MTVLTRTFDPPKRSPETEEYWDAAAQHVLLIRECTQCARRHHPPRGRCPWCGSGDLRWIQSSGRAALHSYTIVAGKTPAAIARIELAEGVSMVTNVVGCTPEDIAIGQSLAVVFVPCTDAVSAVPCFTPERTAP